jgi:cellulose synthase/poly-beta-1,6-N-acetylglucosamine synthase-like glycosyltransferase
MTTGGDAAAPGRIGSGRVVSGLAGRASPFPTAPREAAGARRVRQRLAACPEIDCLRSLISPGPLAAAELRAAETGVGADRVLVASGAISDDGFAWTLADWLGVAFEPLIDIERSGCPLDDARLIEAVAAGMLPLRVNDEEILVIAPQGLGARHLVNFILPRRHLAARVRITTRAHMAAFVDRHAHRAIGRRAAFSLRASRPEFSAALPGPRRILTAALLVFCAGFIATPDIFATATDIMLALIFLGWTGLRLLGALTTGLLWRRNVALSEERLPVYTIIVALYREAASVDGLVASLAALDYPPEKLDIKLVIEPDDLEMQAALSMLPLAAPFEVVTVPAIGPRTKPKALNAALPFARGSFIAVYDAEDRPERDQLRRALQAFFADNGRLACVQARLTIDNTTDTWLTRLFTAEYAGLFDVFLPGIAAWRLPLPLGGSSNHFRTSALREVGAWDPYNVTEDADLGMRLARFGYRAAMIDSATYEEAPSRFVPWLKQRTRWFKGWMQTWLVHMRHPVSLIRDLGFSGFIVFQLVVGGTVLAALIHALFAGALIWQLASNASIAGNGDLSRILIAGLHGTTLVAGYVISGLLAFIGLARRGLLNCAWSLLLMPLYWVLLSIAAWRALLQLILDPYHWEKTQHGLARTSRLATFQNSSRMRTPR